MKNRNRRKTNVATAASKKQSRGKPRATSSRANPRQVEAAVRSGPELVFGLVGAIGSDLDQLRSKLEQCLDSLDYKSETIRLSDLLARLDWDKPLRDIPADLRYQDLMDAGDQYRKLCRRSDAVAVLGVRAIMAKRLELNNGNSEPVARTAYILRGLKTPEEVETLRRVYGSGFILISAYQRLRDRKDRLAENIAKSRKEERTTAHDSAADALIGRDQRDGASEFGQNVRATFPLADIFLDLRKNEVGLQADLRRVLHMIFGFEFFTPTRDEFAMFAANGGALRSAEMGRQVGAAITDEDGNVLAVGTNELPKSGGGLVWSDDQNVEDDPRDWKQGFDRSDLMKRKNMLEVLRSLEKAELLDPSARGRADEPLLALVLPHLGGTRTMNAIEFGRAVHAETAALLDAAKRGVPVSGATMHITTFPCHHCARHLVAAGIRRLVFIEPYPKSLAEAFHRDAIDFPDLGDNEASASDGKHKVICEPFVGVAPRAFVALFTMNRRKSRTGETIKWEPKNAIPRHQLAPAQMSYLEQESYLVMDT